MRTIEDTYLRAIFEGSYLKGGIANKQLSELLKVTPASTTEFTQKLRERGLVKGKKYGKVFLSEKGQQKAQQIMQKFRLCEVLLERHFDLSLSEVVQQAWLLADFSSEMLLQEINYKLGKPEKTFSGSEVQNPEIFNSNLDLLSNTKAGKVVTLREYYGSENMIHYFSELNLALNTKLTVENYDHDFNVFMLLTPKGKHIMVSKEIANFIYVEPQQSKTIS
ncbi:metal-dependent transcriptional regulator [Ligilactobacillus pobuzihii]|nr:metal-dependent transcriptional regulator [Ligilactobacillus pobuzihii]GEN47990.1 hypothetical protein LPO01_07820 [Ligilactobacillus pobuzihii]